MKGLNSLAHLPLKCTTLIWKKKKNTFYIRYFGKKIHLSGHHLLVSNSKFFICLKRFMQSCDLYSKIIVLSVHGFKSSNFSLYFHFMHQGIRNRSISNAYRSRCFFSLFTNEKMVGLFQLHVFLEIRAVKVCSQIFSAFKNRIKSSWTKILSDYRKLAERVSPKALNNFQCILNCYRYLRKLKLETEDGG